MAVNEYPGKAEHYRTCLEVIAFRPGFERTGLQLYLSSGSTGMWLDQLGHYRADARRRSSGQAQRHSRWTAEYRVSHLKHVAKLPR